MRPLVLLSLQQHPERAQFSWVLGDCFDSYIHLSYNQRFDKIDYGYHHKSPWYAPDAWTMSTTHRLPGGIHPNEIEYLADHITMSVQTS